MPPLPSRDTFKTRQTITIEGQAYACFSLAEAEKSLGDLGHLPCSIRILLENLLRHENNLNISVEDMRALAAFHALRKSPPPLAIRPSRLFLHNKTATSTLTDFASLREALNIQANDPLLFSPDIPTDISIEPKEQFTSTDKESFRLLKWSSSAFKNIRLLPPGKGSCEALQMVFLSSVITKQNILPHTPPLLFPEIIMGTSRHICAAGALGMLALHGDVLDIEALLLDSSAPIHMTGVLGIHITGKMRHQTTATDIGLAILKAVKQIKCTGKIIEFYGDSLDILSVPDRIIIADILCETDALSIVFPIDQKTIEHLTTTTMPEKERAYIEAYAKAQGLWRIPTSERKEALAFTSTFDFDLGAVHAAIGGPGLAYNMTALNDTARTFEAAFPPPTTPSDPLALIHHGDIAWASIGPYGGVFSPKSLVAAGLAARRARAYGLKVKPWVKACLTLPCPVLQDLLSASGLLADLEAIGFTISPAKETAFKLQPSIIEVIKKNKLIVCAVTTAPYSPGCSIHNECHAGYIASPFMTVIYALAGSILINADEKNLSNQETTPITMGSLTPTQGEIDNILDATPLSPFFERRKRELFVGDSEWANIDAPQGPLFTWEETSQTIKQPKLLPDFSLKLPHITDIKDGRALAILGNDFMTTRMEPSGPIRANSNAGHLLQVQGINLENGLFYQDFVGNEEIMARGAFQHEGIKNALASNEPSGMTKHALSGLVQSFYDVAMRYQKEKVTCFLCAGQNFGAGEHQEWAAKSIRLLGIPIVVAESFSTAFLRNLIRVGVLPLQLKSGMTLSDLKIRGEETVNFSGITDIQKPPAEVMMTINHKDFIERYMLLCRLDTDEEMDIWRHGSLWAEAARNMIMLAG